jgi:hypothetical protein
MTRRITSFVLALGLLLLAAGDALAQGTVRQFRSIRDLLATDPRAITAGGRGTVELLAWSTNRAGGGGLMAYSTAAPGATNLCELYAPDNGAGSWTRLDWGGDIRCCGAVGDNSEDTTAALVAADAAMSARGSGNIHFPGHETYKFLSHTIRMSSDVGLEGRGTLNFTQSGNTNYAPEIIYSGSRATGVPLQSAVARGANSIILSAPVDWTFGDWIILHDTNDFSFGGRSYYHGGQMANVLSVSGGTNVTLGVPIWDPLPAGGTKAHKITETVARVSGITIATGLKSAGLTIHYGSPRSLVEGVKLYGSDYQLLGLHNCWDSVVRDVDVNWDSDPVGGNYAILVGSCEGVSINGRFATSQSAIEMGNSDTDLDIPVRRIVVYNSTARSTRSGPWHSAGMHGNVVDCTWYGNTLEGLSMGGGNPTIAHNTIYNTTGAAAITAGELRLLSANIHHNTFIIRPQTPVREWVARITIKPVNPGSGGTVDTNIWAGTWGQTSNQVFRFTDNVIRYLAPVRSGDHGIFLDESTLLSANPTAGRATFGGADISRNIFEMPDSQGITNLSTSLIYVKTTTNVVFADTVIRDNVMSYGGIVVESSGGRVDLGGNRIKGALDPVAGIKIFRSTEVWGSQTVPLSASVERNVVDGAWGGGLLLYNFFGDADVHRNTFQTVGWGGEAWAVAVDHSGGPTNLTGLTLERNRFYSDGSTTMKGWSINAPGAHVDISRNTIQGLATVQSVSAGSLLSAPTLTNATGYTNGVSLIGQVSALPTNTPPGLAFSGSQFQFWDGTNWQTIASLAGTNFPNVRATNTIQAADLTAQRLSIGSDWPVAPFAVDSARLYVARSTNGPTHIAVQNSATNSAAEAGITATSGAVVSSLTTRSAANSTAAFAGRGVLDTTGGSGWTMDMDADDSLILSYSGGTDFLVANTNGVTLRAPGTASAPVYLGGWLSNPAGAQTLLSSFSTAQVKAALAITIPDVSGLQAELDNRQATNDHLTSISGLSTNGLLARTASGTVATRHLVGDTEIAVTNGNGVSGNPTLAIGSTITRDSEVGSLLDADLQIIAAFLGGSNLVTGVDFTGHYHSADRNRTNHIGTQAISTIINLQTELDNRQSTNAHLTSVAGLSTNGLLARTASGTVVTRHLVGDTEAVVANGDGVSGNPTVSIGSSIARDAEMALLYQGLNTYLTDLSGMTGLAGTMLYFDGTDLQPLGIGSAGQFLMSTNGPSRPIWATPAASGGSGVWVEDAGVTNPNFAESSEIAWAVTSSTNVTPSLKSGSIGTNRIDATFHGLLVNGSTVTNRLVKTLFASNTETKVFLANTAETNIIGPLAFGSTNLAANYLTSASVIRITASGRYVFGNLDLKDHKWRVKIGSSLTYTFTIPDSGNVPFTDGAWTLSTVLSVTTAGASATVATTGTLLVGQSETGLAGDGWWTESAYAVVTGTLDTTAANTISVTYDNDAGDPVDLYCGSVIAEEMGAEIVSGRGGVSAGATLSINGTNISGANLNSTTPAAPAGYELVPLQVLGTNVSLYTQSRSLFVASETNLLASSVSTTLWSNTIPVGRFSVGDKIQITQQFVSTNTSGSAVSYTPRWIIGTNDISLATLASHNSGNLLHWVLKSEWDVVSSTRMVGTIYLDWNYTSTTANQLRSLQITPAYFGAGYRNLVINTASALPFAFLLQHSISNSAFTTYSLPVNVSK